PAPLAGREPPALGVPARRAAALVRGLAAPAGRAADPRAPPARVGDRSRRGSAVRRGAPPRAARGRAAARRSPAGARRGLPAQRLVTRDTVPRESRPLRGLGRRLVPRPRLGNRGRAAGRLGVA